MKLRMIISLLFALPLLLGCEESESRLFCDVTLVTALPDGRTIVRMEADETLSGTYLRNVNNRMDYALPVFVNYLISFDAVATFSDGSVARVRSSEHANAERAVNLLGDVEAVVLNLTVIN